jgi:DNA (cytosine-5)-methyltransferase 1
VRTEYGKQIRKDYESHAVYEQRKNMQRLEPRDDGLTNTITTVQKDNLLMEEMREPTLIGSDGMAATQEEIQNFRENYSEHKKYRIRKLTPRECYRLMGVSDENASKMLSVNSNTQCYKQAGNSICVPVLMALFSQMKIDGVKPWNDMTEDEIYELIDSHK